MAALSVSEAELVEPNRNRRCVLSTAAESKCTLAFPFRCVLRALLLLLVSIAVVASRGCCCSRLALLPRYHSFAWFGRTPKSATVGPPYQHRTKSPSRLQNSPPHAMSPTSKSPPYPPSGSSTLHPTHHSCSKHEWLDAEFRRTGQRVFCACSRRPSCIHVSIPSPLCTYSFLHFLPFLGIASHISHNTTGRNEPPCSRHHTCHSFPLS
jgi:ssDNA-binding Zn-finger/Zn-ribbon topoisomerase 1